MVIYIYGVILYHHAASPCEGSSSRFWVKILAQFPYRLSSKPFTTYFNKKVVMCSFFVEQWAIFLHNLWSVCVCLPFATSMSLAWPLIPVKCYSTFAGSGCCLVREGEWQKRNLYPCFDSDDIKWDMTWKFKVYFKNKGRRLVSCSSCAVKNPSYPLEPKLSQIL